MPKETITLSHRELDRVSVIESIIAKRLRQHEAARQLDLSVRQITLISMSESGCVPNPDIEILLLYIPALNNGNLRRIG